MNKDKEREYSEVMAINAERRQPLKSLNCLNLSLNALVKEEEKDRSK